METKKRRTYVDFFTDFKGLMAIHNTHLPSFYRILPTIYETRGANASAFTAEDAEKIVDGLKNFEKKQFARIPELKRYLSKTLDTFEFRTSDKKNWEYHYPPDDDVDVYTIELQMIPVLRRLLLDLSRPVAEFFNILRPEERQMILSLSRQKGVPPEIAEHEVSRYVANIPKGGTRRLRRVKRRTYKKKKRKGI